jgi:signal transduction histidine kinase
MGRVGRRALGWVWPQTLSGRVVVILVTGVLAAQALTGTIWWDMRRGQLLDLPMRVVAARAADSLLLLTALAPGNRAEAARTLSSDHYQITVLSEAQARAEPDDGEPHRTANRILAAVISDRIGSRPTVRLLTAELRGDDGRDDSTYAVLTARQPVAFLSMLIPLGEGQWMKVDASEGEAGYRVSPMHALADYVLRIYVLRIAVVVVVALLAVRLAMRPLQRMARAADALGRDLHSPPLPVEGPREVRQAVLAFNIMQRRIAAGVEERTRFLAAVSHDLRSPITRMRLRVEMLDSPELREKFRADLQEMESMVTATLDVLRGVEGQGEQQRVDVNAMLEALVQDLHEAGHPLIPIQGRAQPCLAYAQSLRRCLQNLMENALRYGREARVQVEDASDAVRITVLDAGPGIPDQHLDQVTEPFYRVEGSRNAGSGGFGLGLSIADTVARAHGGSLTLRNRPEGGLAATVTLPRRCGAAPERC